MDFEKALISRTFDEDQDNPERVIMTEVWDTSHPCSPFVSYSGAKLPPTYSSYTILTRHQAAVIQRGD